MRDQARRFITLVDELYNARTRLVCLAACPPDDLFGSAVNEEPLLDLEGLQFETAVEGELLCCMPFVCLFCPEPQACNYLEGHNAGWRPAAFIFCSKLALLWHAC